MRDKVFSKKEFIASVTENVKTMYRKTLKEATQQEIYQAVSLAVKDVVMDEWMATQQVIEKDDPKILYYMSMADCSRLPDGTFRQCPTLSCQASGQTVPDCIARHIAAL